MTEKTFTVVGTSNLNGQIKVRFANDINRVKVLTKNGHTEVVLIQLDEPVTKLEGAKFIQGLDEFQEPGQQQAITELIEKSVAETQPAPKKVKAETQTATVEATPQVQQTQVGEDAALAAAEAIVEEVTQESEAAEEAAPLRELSENLLTDDDTPY